jgi:hypothetical protein
MVWSHQSRIKLLADHAGLSQLLVPCNLIGTSSAKVKMLLFLNNNSLIVLETSITTDAKEDFHPMRSSILDMLEELNQIWLIHTQPRMVNAFTDHRLLSDMLDSEATTLHRVMKNN